MSIYDAQTIDFFAVDHRSNVVFLVIADHLPWDEHEGEHLMMVQEKINAYLAFMESGEIFEKIPVSVGLSIVIKWMGKYPLSEQALKFYDFAETLIEGAGFELEFEEADFSLQN